MQLLRQRLAGHSRHDHVGHDELAAALDRIGEAQRLIATGGFEDVVPAGTESVGGEAANGILVFHHEHGEAPLALGQIEGREGNLFCRALSTWQKNLEAASLSRFAVHADRAAALFDDTVDGGQSEPGSVAAGFGGEERLEEMLDGFFVHAGAGIGHGQLHIGAGLATRRRVLSVEAGVGGAEEEPAAVRHGITRVDRQVEQHLVHLAGIGHDQIERRIEVGLEQDILADEPLQHALRAGDQGVEFEWARLADLAAAEGEQLLGERGRALARVADFLNRLPLRIAFRQVLDEHVAVAVDDGQQVVEVVGHAAGQAADGFQLLRVLQLLAQLFALGLVPLLRGDVDQHHERALELSLFIHDGGTRSQSQHFGPAAVAEAFFDDASLAALESGHALLEERDVFRKHK